MPVELVDLVHGKNIEHVLDLVDGEDVASHVEHKAAICEIGFVADRHGGHDAFAVDDQLAQALQAVEDALRRSAAHLDARRSHGQHLTQGLECVEDAGGLLGCDLYARCINIQTVLFISQRLILYDIYGVFQGLDGIYNLCITAENVIHDVTPEICGPSHALVAECQHNGGRCLQCECSFRCGYRSRLGDDVDSLFCRNTLSARCVHEHGHRD